MITPKLWRRFIIDMWTNIKTMRCLEESRLDLASELSWYTMREAGRAVGRMGKPGGQETKKGEKNQESRRPREWLRDWGSQNNSVM